MANDDDSRARALVGAAAQAQLECAFAMLERAQDNLKAFAYGPAALEHATRAKYSAHIAIEQLKISIKRLP